jgi:hypothetical protein
MIDFAHVEVREQREGEGGDENYMFGLAALLGRLRRLRARAVALEE